LLSKAWVNASENPITDTDQRVGDFWNTVSVNLSDLKAEEESSTIHRDASACRTRFRRHIQPAVSKFSGHMEKVKALKRSGASMLEELSEAKDLFWKVEGNNFDYEASWTAISACPKWSSLLLSSAPTSSPSTSTLSIARPPGAKAAKNKEHGLSDIAHTKKRSR